MPIDDVIRVLLVDDDVNMLTSLCDILEYKGYKTLQANKGAQALISMDSYPADVALIDLRLEDMSGLELIRKLKEKSPFTECILLTGYATQSSAIEAVSSGVFGYFLKPFEFDQVALAIEQAAKKSKTSRALAANEQRLRRLIENGRDNIIVLDAEGLVTWANAAVESDWGYSFTENSDVYTAGPLHPEETKGLSQIFQKVVGTPGSKEDITFRIRQKSGEWRWVEGTIVNLLMDPSINGVVINFRDITEQKQAQDKLRLQGTALDAAANAMVITERDGKIIWVNTAFTTLTNYTFDDVLGKNPRLWNSGKQPLAFYKNLWETVNAGKIWHGELVNKRKDGTLYQEEMTITPLLDTSGEVQNFIAIKQDITERKKIERALALSESRFRRLFEDSPVAIKEENFSEVKKKLDAIKKKGVTNWQKYFEEHPEIVQECADLAIVEDVNAACVILHKAQSRDQLIGPLSRNLPKSSILRFQDELVYFATGLTQFSAETVNTRLDGSQFDVKVFCRIPPENEQDLAKVIVTLIDISERKEYEKKIEQHNRELNLLYNAGKVLSQSLDLNQISASFYDLISTVITCDSLFISECTNGLSELEIRFAVRDGKTVKSDDLPTISDFSLNSPFDLSAIAEGKSLIVNDYKSERGDPHKQKTGKISDTVETVESSSHNLNDYRSAIVIPILFGNQVRGIVTIHSKKPNAFKENDRLVAESMVAQIAVSMNNASLYQERVKELEARIKAEGELRTKALIQEKIVALGRELATTMELTTIYKIAHSYLKKMIKCANYAIILFDNNNQELIPAFVSADNKFLDVSSLPPLKFDPQIAHEGRGKAINTRSPVIMTDLEVKRKSGGGQLFGSQTEPQSAIYIPMLAEDKVIGLVDLQSYEENAFSEEDSDWLSVVANMIGLAIQNAKLQAEILHELSEKEKIEAEIRQSLIELEMLYENALTVNQLFDTNAIGSATIKLLAKRFPEYHSVLRLREKDSDVLRMIDFYVPGINKEKRVELEKKYFTGIKKVGEGLSGYIVKTGEGIRIPDVNKDPRYNPLYPGITSGLYVPIKVGQYVIGSIALESEKPDAFTSRDERLVSTIANQAAIAFDNASLYQAVQKELAVRVKTETALRESQGRLQSILDNTSALVYIKDLQGRYQLVNKAMAAVLDMPEQNVVGKRISDIVLYPELGQHEENDKIVLTKKIPITFEETHTLKGKANTFLSVKFPIWNEKKEIIAICGISTDITEQKRGEDQLRLMSHMVEQSPALVVLTDPDGNIEYINKKFTEEIGYTPEEVLGKNPRILKSGHTTPEEYTRLWQTIKSGKEWRGEFQNRRKDGSLLWESASISPIFDNRGDITHFLGIKENITLRKEAEFELVRLNQELEERVNRRTQELHEANKELEKASRLKDEFLASMSHELRTPLTGVLGLSEAMQKGIYGALNEKQITILKTIEEGGRHLLNLINDILDLSKIEAGKLELEQGVVNVEEVCQSSLRMVKQIANARQQRTSLSISPADLQMFADSKRIKQILVNLLSNAVKFTPENGEIGLQVTGDSEKDLVTFIVWDTGIGIAKKDMDKLFKPFIQIDSSLSRNYAGTGLGLSLVHRFVKMHGGTVSVESEVGKGSRFIVTLPWQKAKVETSLHDLFGAMQEVKMAMNSGSTQQNLGKVLIVDDNQVNSTMLSDYLSYKGFQTVILSSGQEALTRISEINPNVVLMDIQMPGIDGLEVIRRVRKMQGPIANVGMIALTALAMSEDRQKCIDAGADDYVSKPVDLDVLMVAINSLKGRG